MNKKRKREKKEKKEKTIFKNCGKHKVKKILLSYSDEDVWFNTLYMGLLVENEKGKFNTKTKIVAEIRECTQRDLDKSLQVYRTEARCIADQIRYLQGEMTKCGNLLRWVNIYLKRITPHKEKQNERWAQLMRVVTIPQMKTLLKKYPACDANTRKCDKHYPKQKLAEVFQREYK